MKAQASRSSRARTRSSARLGPWLAPLFLGGCAVARGARTEDAAARPLPTIEAHTRGLEARPGRLPLYWDERRAALLLEVPELGRPLAFSVALVEGLGSNDVGLDRGQLGPRHLVELRRAGGRVLLVAPNLAWRSSASSEEERRGVRESFAESVLAGFEPVAESDGRLLVDATGFFLRDAHGIAARLAERGQGAFQLDPARSVILFDETASFPDNTEVEVLLTFAGEDPGSEVRSTTPDPRAVSLRVRYSFVALPELSEHGYTPRRYHPRSGFFPLEWNDLAAPVDEPVRQRVITRHRLDAEHPIVYWVDRAAPEPVRTALLEGARYWEPVFARAGFPGGFRVELLPAGADPLDARYNVIQWVNRSTRGWSYGDAIVDPRTGEILKGHVTLGALRVRQDVRIVEGLLSPYGERGASSDPRVVETALARIRQLAAHEVGHTLGLAHNFAASAEGRASVMDYPAPLVRLTGAGEIDLAAAYAAGCGPWDEQAIRYGYAPAARAPTPDALEEPPVAPSAGGLRFLSDEDARGADRAHPLANLWDNGADPLEAFEETVRVRAAALARFSEAALKPGRALSELEAVLVPLYFHHRYQLEALVRALGGVSYEHRLAHERWASPALVPVPAAVQERALELVLDTLEPSFLALPRGVRASLVPPAPGYDRDRESFDPRASFFDPLAAAAAAADLALELLLDPERARRLADQALADPEEPSLADVLERLVARLWDAAAGTDEERALREEVQAAALDRLFALVTDERASERVRAAVHVTLVQLARSVANATPADPARAWQRERLRRYLEDPATERVELRTRRLPPGSPIGSGDACGTRAPAGFAAR